MPIVFFLILFLGQIGFADSMYNLHLNARSQAMGGTSIAYTSGVDALFQNASALSKIDGYVFDIARVNAAASTNSQRLLDQMKNQGSTLSAADLQGLYGENYFADISAHSGMVIPRFGFAFFSNNFMTEVFNNPVYPTFNINFLSEYGYLVGTSIPITSDLSFGIAGRHIQRWSGDEDILVSDLIGTNEKDLIDNRFQDKGVGDALDLSLSQNFPSSNLNLSLSWKDVGNTAFKTTSGNGPERQEENLSFGAAKTDTLGFFDMTYAFEYNHIRQSGPLVKKLHLGAEASIGLLDLRVGLNQGYLTYGVGIDLWLFRLDAAAYSEEIGVGSSLAKSDRYQATLTFALDFDQAFKVKNQFGKKRRLLQRR